MSVTTALKHAQRAAEKLMVDTCKIQRGGDDVDPLTGMPILETVYAGKCRLQVTSAQASTGQSIGYTFTKQDYELHLPASVESPRINDAVILTSTPTKPSRVGQQFRVAAQFEKTFQSAQRIKIESIT